MTLEETADLALKQAQRAKDYTDILNVFSAHLYCYRAQQQSYEMEHYWARQRDDLVYANAQGRKAVMDFYCGHNAVMRAEKRKIASAYYPEISDTDSFDGVGDMVAKAAASPYIIIAEDGLSAHGIWFVPGFCCELGKDGAIQANYFQEKNAVDLVKEDDGWKILRLNILVDFQTPCPHIRFSRRCRSLMKPGRSIGHLLRHTKEGDNDSNRKTGFGGAADASCQRLPGNLQHNLCTDVLPSGAAAS